MAKITGIGGVFIKSKGDGAALAAWYRKHLGMQLEDFGGAILRWPDDKAEDKGLTVWTVAKKDSQWFSPSNASLMINYRVDNLTELLKAALAFLIGGPDGHGEAALAQCHEQLSLGPMTLPHGLARVVLLEQIYRAITILSGHPYHRA